MYSMINKAYLIFIIKALCMFEVELKNLKCEEVFLTVYKNRLIINWVPAVYCNKCDHFVKYPDKIAVFSKDPQISGSNNPLAELTGEDLRNGNGYSATSIEFGTPPLPGNWNYENSTRDNVVRGFQCLPFWAASFKNGVLLYSRCLGINPTWMEDHKAPIHKLKINEAFLPGTHNSAVYERMDGMDANFELCQQLDVWSQLVYGIRYLDITVGYFDDSFHVTAHSEKLQPLEMVLKQIRKFSEVARFEVIIVFFNNFNQSTHNMMLELIDKELRPRSFSRDKGYEFGSPTIAMLCNLELNIVPSYGHTFQDRPNEKMPRVTQHYTLARNEQAVKSFFRATKESISKDEHEMQAIVAHIDTGPTNGVDFEKKVNGAITDWFRVIFEFETKFNIIAIDNFLESDLISVAVDINIDRGT